MTDPEDPARTASASTAQAVAVAATAAELLAHHAARRASDRADGADRQTAALRTQAAADTAAGRLALDACGDPMPSPTAVLAPPASSSGQRPEGAGQVIDGQVVARAYPVPQTAQTTAAAQRPSPGGGGTSATAGAAQTLAAARAAAAPPRPPTARP